MPRGVNRFRRVVAALLALVLLAVPGALITHASAAAPLGQHGVHHCVTQDDMAADQAPVAPYQGQPGRHPGDVQDLACCASAQCPATAAVPLAPPGQPIPPSGLRLVGSATRVVPDGICVTPPLHPPRPLA